MKVTKIISRSRERLVVLLDENRNVMLKSFPPSYTDAMIFAVCTEPRNPPVRRRGKRAVTR